MSAAIYDNGMKAKEEELLESSSISNEDKALITKFVNFKVAESGITSNRAAKTSRILRLIAVRYLNGAHYNDLTHDDIVGVVAAIEQGYFDNGVDKTRL